jgi:hypothetical protein
LLGFVHRWRVVTDKYEIIPVDHLVASPETENTFDLRRLPPHDLDRIEIRVGNDSTGNFGTIGSQDAHGITTLESPTRLDDTRGQETFALEKRTQCTSVNRDRTCRTQCSCYPLFSGSNR